MSAARLFKSFGNKEARAAEKERERQHKRFLRTSKRLDAIRTRIRLGVELTDVDHRIIARCGPETLKYLGYQPMVQIQ